MSVFGGLTPSGDTEVNPLYRVQQWAYGNGYKAWAPDGANGLLYTAQINFDYLSSANYATLLAWLVASPPWVTWTGDGSVLSSSLSFRVTADGWQVTTLPGGVYQVQFDVEQAF